MIARFLLFIKHRIPWLWIAIDWVNACLYRILHKKNMAKQAGKAFHQFKLENFEFRPLIEADLYGLQSLLGRQSSERLEYFRPHSFDYASLKKMHSNPAFLMFGVFNDQRMVGYFFLRCFWNRKCFVGRLIDEPFERKGIGRVMNQILYNTSWWSEFRCFTSISKNNKWIMRAHAKNPHARFVAELANGYRLVEFVSINDEDEEGVGG